MAAKTKNKLKKYDINNISDEVNVGEKLTKKATLEWLQAEILSLTDEEGLIFATDVYGENIPNLKLHPVMIKHINKIAGQERLKKLLKKDLRLGKKTYRITLWKDPDE